MSSVFKSRWYTQPAKSTLIIVFLVWLVGVSVIVLNDTNLFTRSFISSGFIASYFAITMLTIVLWNVFRNYRKSQG